jgi:dihydrofolate synthase/folylpolyglutamate synthase
MVLDHLGALGVVCRSHETTTGVGAWLLDEKRRIKAQLPGRLERRQVSALDQRSNRMVSIPIVLDGAHVPFRLEAVLKEPAAEPDPRITGTSKSPAAQS